MQNKINYSLNRPQTNFNYPKGWVEMKGTKKPVDEIYLNYRGFGSKPVKRSEITQEMIQKEEQWAEYFIY
jgi:hypothetical protein